jgi:hypothetical protein
LNQQKIELTNNTLDHIYDIVINELSDNIYLNANSNLYIRIYTKSNGLNDKNNQIRAFLTSSVNVKFDTKQYEHYIINNIVENQDNLQVYQEIQQYYSDTEPSETTLKTLLSSYDTMPKGYRLEY